MLSGRQSFAVEHVIYPRCRPGTVVDVSECSPRRPNTVFDGSRLREGAGRNRGIAKVGYRREPVLDRSLRIPRALLESAQTC